MRWIVHALTGMILLAVVAVFVLVACLILFPAFCHSVGSSFWEAYRQEQQHPDEAIEREGKA